MLIDKKTVNHIIDDLAYLFNALEHNELEATCIQKALNHVITVRDKAFCSCDVKHDNNVKVCPTCNKHVYIRWDGLI